MVNGAPDAAGDVEPRPELFAGLVDLPGVPVAASADRGRQPRAAAPRAQARSSTGRWPLQAWDVRTDEGLVSEDLGQGGDAVVQLVLADDQRWCDADDSVAG